MIANPFCRECGIGVSHVEAIVPDEDNEGEWLCLGCHARRSTLELWGVLNAIRAGINLRGEAAWPAILELMPRIERVLTRAETRADKSTV